MRGLTLAVVAFFVLGIRGWSCALAAQEAFAAMKDYEGKAVTAVEVKNNKSISSATILAKIQTTVGKPFSQTILNQDLKRLYATDFFTDIAIEVEDFNGGAKVIFAVTEKPVVDKVLFEGNKVIRTDRLQPLVKIKEGQMLNYRELKAATEQISAMYEKNGFHLAKIQYDVKIDQKTNRGTVVFQIAEAERVRIKKIYFDGNYAFSSKKLLRLITTRASALFTSGYYKKDVFEEDIEKISDFYKREGYMDVKVDKQLDYDSTGKNLTITVKITEGKKYLVGTITITGNKVFPEFKLRSVLTMLPHSIYNEEGLKSDVVKLQEYYFHDGYISARITSDTVLNSKTGNIDITYRIAEGELAYVDRIEIRGNTKTKDVIIRRELRIYPGEKFDGQKLKRSKERLYNLGYFEEINYDVEPGSAENKKNLIVSVKETKTGEFSFGGGYSSIDKLIGFVDLTQKNFDIANWPTFTGGGQELRLHTEFGTVREDYVLSFTEPWIFGYPYLFGFDLFQRSHSRSTDVGYGYDETRRGGDLRFGKEFTEYDRADLMYMMESVQIGDVSSSASNDLKMEEGTNRINTLGLALTHDTRDNVYNPATGLLAVATADYAGGALSGDKNFMRYTLGSSVFFTTFKTNVLELKGKAGTIDTFGGCERVPIYERFFAGGANTIRGYKERRVGPRDALTGDPIGGKSLLLGTAEYTVPLIKVIKGAVFYDVGNVWPTTSEIGFEDLKYSTGVGARIKTPLGPVKLDYGIPLKSASPGERKSPRFHFSMSRGF
jgi:outer membrane protein insertion porin family